MSSGRTWAVLLYVALPNNWSFYIDHLCVCLAPLHAYVCGCPLWFYPKWRTLIDNLVKFNFFLSRGHEFYVNSYVKL